MSILQDHIPVLQTYWATEFTDSGTSVVIKEETGSAFNETTGQTEPTFTARYTGAAVIQPLAPGDEDFGETLAEVRQYRVFIPFDEATLEPGFLVDVTSTEDGYLDGNTLTAKNVRASTWNVVRTLICEENQSV